MPLFLIYGELKSFSSYYSSWKKICFQLALSIHCTFYGYFFLHRDTTGICQFIEAVYKSERETQKCIEVSKSFTQWPENSTTYCRWEQTLRRLIMCSAVLNFSPNRRLLDEVLDKERGFFWDCYMRNYSTDILLKRLTGSLCLFILHSVDSSLVDLHRFRSPLPAKLSTQSYNDFFFFFNSDIQKS